MVYTQSAHGRAEQTVNKQHLKQSQAEYKAFNALTKRSFACVADAEAALAHLQKTLKVVALHEPRIVAPSTLTIAGQPMQHRLVITWLGHIFSQIEAVVLDSFNGL